MRTDVRLSTAIVVIGICGLAVAQGFGIVDFSLALASIDSPQMRGEIVNIWSSAPDVGSKALQADLTYQIDTSDRKATDHRRKTLSALASMTPLSSFNWLSLSGLQLITDQPMEQVFDSLKLSMLTGPNEGYVIEDRRFFGVSLWERLPPDLKRRVAADVAVGEMPDGEKFRAFASGQPEEVRNELRDALVAAGLSANEIETRLGF
jgi:hypothetical protein